jgi:hypothetical protein
MKAVEVDGHFGLFLIERWFVKLGSDAVPM